MKKLIMLSSALLGVIFLAGCGQQQASQTQSTPTPSPVVEQPVQPAAIQPTPTVPTAQPVDETTSWQIYRNSNYGFEFEYPTKWNLSSDTINNPSNSGIKILVKSSEGDKKSIEISVTKNYPNLPDYDSNAPVSSNKIGSQKAQEQIFPKGYCDSLSCSSPFIGIWTKKNDYIYTFNFADTTEIRSTYQQILSTFKFIN